MIKAFWVLIIIIAAITGLHARRLNQTSLVTGRVVPPTSVNEVWAIRGKDSMRAVPKDGAFVLQLQTGQYRIIIQAHPPYKNIVKEGVVAEEGKNTDLGEIKLEQ